MPRKSHQTKDKGDFAVAYVIADLRANGIIPCLPLSEHLPFDMVAVMPDMQSLIRLQVKYRGNDQNEAVKLSFRSNYYDSKKIYTKPVDLNLLDAYALYSAVHQAPIYFRVDEIPTDNIAISFRFRASKNNQQIGVRMAQDYRNPMRLSAQILESQNLLARKVSAFDEIAIAKAALYLREQGMFILYPQSQYTPFDLLAVSPDMQAIQRYRIGYEEIEFSTNVDVFLKYDSIHDNFQESRLALGISYS